MKPTVYETTWYGGNTIQPEPRYRVLAVNASAAGWKHRARVWRDENGRACGEWFDNGMEGDLPKEPKRSGVWRPFVHETIPAALLEEVDALVPMRQREERT